MRHLRMARRAARLLVHLGWGLLLAAALRLDPTARLRPEALAQAWSRRLLAILNIRVAVHGQAVAGARMTVANHISWLDIPLLAASEPTRFIAKSEVRRWPVAGGFARAIGTFFIRRGKGGARPVVERLLPHLRSGGAVVLFPEGTTTDGRALLPFHARLFSAPIEAGAAVQPVALRYAPGASGRPVAPFIGDDDLFRHILRLLREPALQAEIHYCKPIASAGQTRGSLAAAAEDAVRAALGLAANPAALRAA